MPPSIARVADQHMFGGLVYLALHAPDLARATRAGQYVLVRCAPEGANDPLLSRTLFVASSDPQAGLVRLLFAPSERGLAWLAAQARGTPITLVGPLGTPFSLERSTRHLLLVGAGPALPALLMLAHEATRRQIAVVLQAAAQADLLPPPFLLPPEVEYQALELVANTTAGSLGDKEAPALSPTLPVSLAHLSWADQVVAALPPELVQPLVDTVRSTKLRWERGFAQVALSGSMPCVSGACLTCLVDTRHGLRLRCKDGPVFDLRDMR